MQIETSSYQIGGASANTSSIREQLINSLKKSKEYRHSFVEEKIRTGVAAQIKAIREHREGGMTQKRFAEILDKSQSWIARLEDPNAEVPTLSSLLQVAHAFDVDLEVRFAPFSELVDWISGTPHWVPGLSAETLAVEDFEHELGLATQAVEQAVSIEASAPARQLGTMGQIIPFSHQRELPFSGQRQALEGTLTGSSHRTPAPRWPITAPPSQAKEANYAAVGGYSR